MEDHQNNHYQNKIPNPDYQVILYYLYTKMSQAEAEALKEREMSVCKVLDLKGRIIIAQEGINGTLEGTVENIKKYKEHILSDKRFRKMNIKDSVGTGDAFPRLSVKVREEIVGTKLPKHIDPTKQTGVHLNPAELKRWYDEGEEFYVIDMRNDYEVKVGHFENTINKDTPMKASRELPELVKTYEAYKHKKVLPVCTGGVRCEKMSAYLIDQGFTDVYQLHNGMHAFMEKYPGQHFKGALYTFDNRMTMDWGGDREIVGTCHACHAQTENFGHCADPMCHAHLLICSNCINEKQFCNEVCKAKVAQQA